MEYYLPNFEDLVDPDYDFVHDAHSLNHKNRRENDKYAHEFFDKQIFDGMLVSKASLNPSIEKQILTAGDIHHFTRLNTQIPIMADCGAFTYRLEEKPSYTTQQVIDFYENLGFNYGVSLDHLAFITIEELEKSLEQGFLKQKWWDGKTSEQIKEERFKLTLENAKKFLDLYSRQKPKFVPVGIAQGGSADLYLNAVEKLIKMGYGHIALGGLVKSSNEDIKIVLRKIQPLIKNGIQLHIFGIGRLSMMPDFNQFGVTSFDSASPMRRAFLGAGEDNYWTADDKQYAAIRVPDAGTRRKKRGIEHPDDIVSNGDRPVNSVYELTMLEKKALNSLRAYDKSEIGLDETLDAVLKYDRLFGEKRDHISWYQRTLADKPWKNCNCQICKKVGIEVVIFRGNNRNRRRGFHNVKVYYDQLQSLIRSISME